METNRINLFSSEPLKPKKVALEEALNLLVRVLAERLAERLREIDAPRLLTVREVAKYLNRSMRWVQLEIASGRLPAVREGNSRPRIERGALDQWIDQHNGRD